MTVDSTEDDAVLISGGLPGLTDSDPERAS